MNDCYLTLDGTPAEHFEVTKHFECIMEIGMKSMMMPLWIELFIIYPLEAVVALYALIRTLRSHRALKKIFLN
jgi:hypothetical protein